MALVIYAIKNDIDQDTVKKDINGLMKFLNSLNPDEPFTQSDVDSAMDCFDERYMTFPRRDISRLSGIVIKENKRNGLPQKVHLKAANNSRYNK